LLRNTSPERAAASAWTWLIGAYVEAHYRVYGDQKAALALLLPFSDHLRDAGLGSIS
jgi:glycogen debranching enzyme